MQQRKVCLHGAELSCQHVGQYKGGQGRGGQGRGEQDRGGQDRGGQDRGGVRQRWGKTEVS